MTKIVKVHGNKKCGKGHRVGECTCGRPKVMTPEVLEKLKDACLMGVGDVGACAKAGIKIATFRKYKTNNPEFVEQLAMWRSNRDYIADVNLTRALANDKTGKLCLDYKKLTDPKYKTITKTEVDVTHYGSDKAKNELNELLESFDEVIDIEVE